MSLEHLALDIHTLTRQGGLLDHLHDLLPEPVADPTIGTTTKNKTIGSPAPWHTEAAAALFDIHEGARRLEASLRRDVSGRLGDKRGSSDQNTAFALKSISRLAEGLSDDQIRAAARIVGRWVTRAQQIRDIDTTAKWEGLPRVPGHLPPACDYCGTFGLRVNRNSGTVRCCNPECVDENGDRPTAQMAIGKFTGRASLTWADGRSISYQAQSEAEDAA